MKSYEIGQAINTLCPGAEFTLVGDDYADIVWLVTPTTIPTQADIDNWVSQIPIRAATDAKDLTDGIGKLEALNLTIGQAKAVAHKK